MKQILERCKLFFGSSLFFPFLCALIFWIFSFRGFLTGHLTFTEDAISYLNQAKYLTDGFLKGIFPVWNFASFGMPNDFFLLRLGAINPFYVLVAMCRAAGIPFLFAYAGGLSLYYFLGCGGFYLICKRVTNDRLVSFSGFLLLYFSALGTRIFDSFIVLTFVPLVWFFFFLVDFFQKSSRKNFLGMVFCSMILLSTYIPFYFILIFLIFSAVFLCIFPLRFLNNLNIFSRFIIKEKLVFSLGVMAIIIALIPGFLFFQAVRDGDYVMPSRQHQIESNVAVEVHSDTIKAWAIFEDIAYSSDFTDFKRMKFAVFYIPIIAWLILCCGIITPFSRKALFYLFFMGCFFVLGTPRDFPVYSF